MNLKIYFVELYGFKLKSYLKYKLCFIFSFLVMFPGFFLDFYKVVNPREAKNYGKISEALVVGRLAESQKNGLFSDGGFVGYALMNNDSVNIPENQYRIYIEKLPYSSFGAYKTTSGFQALVFGLIDKATNFSNNNNLKFFRFINSVLLSLSLAIILLFIFYYTGFLAYLSSLFAIIFSICLTALGPNLFFGLWALYFPLILVLVILSYEDIYGKYSQKKALLLIFTGIFIKCLFNGFEFITTILIMMMVPLFFFMIRNDWPARVFIRRILLYSSIAIAAVILNMIIISAQISVYEKTADAGVNHLIKSFFKRTSGIHGNFDFNSLVIHSLNASASDAINNQLRGVAYRVDWIPGILNTNHLSLNLTYTNLIIIFALSSFLLLLLLKYFQKAGFRKSVRGFLLMTWVSFLAPLSWYVIFKAHAYIHVSLDLLAWYLPFAIFGAAVTGLLIKALFLFFLPGKLKDLELQS
jgi:hypothetical protein